MNNDVIFQILDWNYYHENEYDPEDKKYAIRLFGKTNDNKSIYVKVTDFTPYFYIELDRKWGDIAIDSIIEFAKKNAKIKVGDRRYETCSEDGLHSYEVVKKYKFKEFTNFRKFRFLKLMFNDIDTMRGWYILFNSKQCIPNISIGRRKTKLKLYESNIEPFLRCMHILDIDAAGWVKIKRNKIKEIDDYKSHCEINIATRWKNIKKYDERTIQPFIIASFDIECTSIDGSFPQSNRPSDKIIQIGTTFSRFGEDDCYYQHIITLGSCDPIKGATVIECKDEKDVLLEWAKLIRETDPDIITGYNIFGFDYKYMNERARLLKIDNRFTTISRIIDQRAKFVEKDLASSALGQNKLTYFDMIGRVNIDLMKVVQREYKLSSYKLDYVASYFIKENIDSLKHKKNKYTIIYTNKTDGIKKDRYITVNYNDGITDNQHMNGKKFKVRKVRNNMLEVEGLIDLDIMNSGYKVYWCQAKDDIEPKDIFRLQKGSSSDRAIIAKYCLMDCALCNKLLSKISVLENNIAMANVCHVPLSYIFYRGQGIKIFSLIAKKCREKEHLIPVLENIKAKKDDEEDKKEESEEVKFNKFINKLNYRDYEETDDDDNDGGYEGATVFEPEKGVHYDPTIVLDYSSLYPNAMILKNLSHEYLVTKKKYMNLPNYKYNHVTFLSDKIIENYKKKNRLSSRNMFRKRFKEVIESYRKKKYIIKYEKSDNYMIANVYDIDNSGNRNNLVSRVIIDEEGFKLLNYETAIFAENIDKTKGIIPEILQGLLDARKRTKKEMELEKDPFKKSVLDGKQLAEKITSNSLYGQTGSIYSKVYMKEIAASTTATGREYLEFARDFLKNEYNNMINYILEDKSKFINYCQKTYSEIDENKFNQPWNNFTNRSEFYETFYNKFSKLLDGYHLNCKIIYGDTDSVFFKPRITDNNTKDILMDKKALEMSIQIGIWASICIGLILPHPMNMEYEKVLYPFILLTKKRYVGNLYEYDINKYKQNSMGIVLKRRDNAQIVKIVVGGIVNEILNNHSSEGAINFTRKILRDILSKKYSMDKFIITKTLRGPALNKDERLEEQNKEKYTRYYVNRESIVHAVLADRIADRDYGNKPQSNDRIEYVYITVKGKIKLQGERVETPEFIIQNNLKIDYLYYITSQIMKPSIQFLELLVNNADDIFNEYIIREKNRQKGLKTIKSFQNKNMETNEGDIMLDNDMNMLINLNNNKIKKKRTNRKKKKINEIDYSKIEENEEGFFIHH